MVACFALTALLAGCELKYYYNVVNQTNDTLRLEMSADNTPHQSQIFTLLPRRKELIYLDVDRGNWSRTPTDEFEKSPDMSLPPRSKVKIYEGERLLSDELLFRKHWEYKIVNQAGIYTLNITDELLKL